MLCIWQPVSGTHRKRLSSQGSAHPPERRTRSPNPDPRGQALSIALSSSLHRQQGQPCPSSGPGHLPQPQGQEGLSCSTHTGTEDPGGERKGSTGPGSKGRTPVLARLWGEVGGQNSHPLAPREAPNPQGETARAPATGKARVCRHPAQEPRADKAALEMPSKCTNRQAETVRAGLPAGWVPPVPGSRPLCKGSGNAFPRLPHTLPRQAVATAPPAPGTAQTRGGQSI